MADTKKEYTSNLHPKGDMDTTVYPNVKSENIIDKDTTAYTDGKVPDSSLVKKSLDSLSENLETTKIQVATNKKNIETLQGNYTGLQYQVNTNSSDIALTKTQVETNKTNIATLQGDVSSLKSDNTQNKKDIANLKANYTEVQSQANQNSIDIASLKTNAIKMDTDASLKSLTLPSASDLKTKDGTSFGGGDTSSIPTDINVDSEYNLILEHDGTEITGQKKLNKTFKNTDGVFTYKDKIRFYTEFNENGNTFLYTINKNNNYDIYQGGFKYFQRIWNNTATATFGIYAKSNNTSYPFRITFQIESNLSTNKAEYLINLIDPNDSYKRINIHFPPKSGTLALTSDLEAKQDKRFVHTVEIHYASNGSYFCFTGTSDKNTPIDSVEDLTTVFANRDLSGVGVFGSAGLSKIHVGSSVNDTTFKKYMNNGEYTNPSEETFAMVFNTTGFTITDSVIPL